MKMTVAPPKGEGYFWWTNGGEHTPTILEVRRSAEGLYASNGEYGFPVGGSEIRAIPDDDDEQPVFSFEGVACYHGTSLWSAQAIELPEIDGEFVLPNSF